MSSLQIIKFVVQGNEIEQSVGIAMEDCRTGRETTTRGRNTPSGSLCK